MLIKKRKRIRRTVSVTSLLLSFLILTACIVSSGTVHIAANDSSAKRTIQKGVPEFAKVSLDPEPSGYEAAEPAPEAKAFEEAFKEGFEEQDFIIYINNRLYSKRVMLDGDVLYVGIADFALGIDKNAVIDKKSASVKVDTENVSLWATGGSPYILANGRYLWCAGGVKNENGILMIPLSTLCTVFGASRYSDGERVSVTSGHAPLESGDSFYNKESVYWLSRIISAESKGESLRGKIAVGNVVLNRVRSKSFPSTIYGVIFDTKNGVQFAPVSNGTVYNSPDSESIIAAKLCLEGVSVSNSILYFLNPDTATNFWITENRRYVTTIGNHKFYS